MSRFPQVRWQGGSESHRSRSLAAFTLIELVIVMVIIGTVGAIALPRYAQAICHYRLSNALNRVVADIGAVRSLAMATNQSQTLSVNYAANTYTITGMASIDNKAASYTVDLNVEPYKTNMSQAGFGLPLTTITFDAYGTPNNTGSIFMVCGGVTKSVSVDATGKATVP